MYDHFHTNTPAHELSYNNWFKKNHVYVFSYPHICVDVSYKVYVCL